MKRFVGKLGRVLSFLKISFSFIWLPKNSPRVVQVLVNGSKLLVFANEDVGRELVNASAYETRETMVLKRIVRKSDTCFDVGANVGYYTTLLASLASEGEVHSFEPVPINWHVLNCNVLLNQLRNVSLNFCALAEKIGKVTFSVSRDGAYSSLKATGREEEVDLIETEVETIDSYCNRKKLSRIDVLKVDVEGAEGLVVGGAASILSDVNAQPRVVMLELFDENLAPFGTTVPELVTRLSDFGYFPFVAGAHGELLKFEEVHRNRLCNVFFLRRDSTDTENS